jgi:hypothetical protein
MVARCGATTLPGAAILLISGYSFLDSHIFWPRGVFTMLGFAIGFGWFGWFAHQRSAATDPNQPQTSSTP